MMEFNVNNISTVATTIWVSIIAPILLYLGIQIDQALGVGVLTGILTVVWMIWNAKNPNEIEALGNAPVEDYNDEIGVDDEL